MSKKVAFALTLLLSAADISALATEHEDVASIFDAGKGSSWKLFLSSAEGRLDRIEGDTKHVSIQKDKLKITAFSEGPDRTIKKITIAEFEHLLTDAIEKASHTATLLLGETIYPVRLALGLGVTKGCSHFPRTMQLEWHCNGNGWVTVNGQIFPHSCVYFVDCVGVYQPVVKPSCLTTDGIEKEARLSTFDTENQ